jgi:3-oxoadipate enol-lactonase
MQSVSKRMWPAVERGKGRTVVFLHGYPLNHAMWEPQLEAISDDHRVVLLDLAGYGLAEDEPVPETLRDYSEKVFLTLAARYPIDVVLVGHSFGGYVALQLYQDHPGLPSGLVLANTRAAPDTAEAQQKRLETVRRLGEPGQTLDVDATARALLAPAHWQAGGPLVESVRSMVRDARIPAIRGALNAIANRPDLRPVLPTITVPTLVLWGEEDQLIPPAETKSMVGQIPGAAGVGIPGAGHLASLEAPELFNRALAEFLRRLIPP